MHRKSISIAINRGRKIKIAVKVRRPQWQQFIQY